VGSFALSLCLGYGYACACAWLDPEGELVRNN
jgi:hypothetical protein